MTAAVTMINKNILNEVFLLTGPNEYGIYDLQWIDGQKNELQTN